MTPSSVQADNGAGLSRRVIGFVIKSQPSKPDDFGTIRAWGAKRGYDYLETATWIDAKSRN